MSRKEWISGALLGVLLVAGVISLLVAYLPAPAAPGNFPPGAFNRAGTPVGPTPSFAGQTAKVAYAAAQNVALGWQNDATLLSATATWSQGAGRSELLPGENSWVFTFYAAGSGQTAVISVVAGQATLVRESQAAPPAVPLQATGWKIDSAAAVQSIMAAGGETFLKENPVSTLVATLSTNGGDGRIEWFLSLFGNHSGRSLTILLDATSGELLEVH
jgi:hypothetical protein